MAEHFSFDEDETRRASSRLDAAGRRLRAAHQRLEFVLEDHDGCWGGDEIGNAFAKNYVPNADSSRKNGAAFAENGTGVAEFVDKAVTTFRQVDEDNATRIDRSVSENVRGWGKD